MLVHLDSSTFIRPAARARRLDHGGDGFDDDNDDDMLEEEQVHPWTHGVADDVWHQRLEATSSGAAAGQHRPRRQYGGRRRQVLASSDLLFVPLAAPPLAGWAVAPSPNGVSGTVTEMPLSVQFAVTPANGARDSCAAPPDATPVVNTSDPLLQPMPPHTQNRKLLGAADPVADLGEAMHLPTSGSLEQSMPVLQPSCAAPDSLVEKQHAAADVDTLQLSVCTEDCSRVLQLHDAADERETEALCTPIQSCLQQGIDGLAVGFQAHGTTADVDAASSSPHGPTAEGPTRVSTSDLLSSLVQPVTPGIIPTPSSQHTPPGPPRRSKSKQATATRRSHRVQNRKQPVTGGGNMTMRAAHKLIISKRGLAIAEKGEESDDDTLKQYQTALDSPLSSTQMGRLTILAKSARGRRRATAATEQLVTPVQ